MLALFAAMAAVTPTLARAQTPVPTVHAAGDLVYLSVNAVLDGLTAAVTSAARGGSFFAPFAHGTLGGAASYAGKRVTASGSWGAGLVGRQVSAAGASMVRGAAFGDGFTDTLFLPLGPGRLHVPIRGGAPVGYAWIWRSSLGSPTASLGIT